MRRVALFVVLLAVACGPCAALEETVEALKARVEKASPDERIQLSVRIAQEQLQAADKLYKEGQAEEARTAVDDIASYCEKARDAAIQTRKHLKNVEIDSRKMAEKLRDIKRTVAFEDQAPIDGAIHRLEDVRTSLLKEMFGSKGKK